MIDFDSCTIRHEIPLKGLKALMRLNCHFCGFCFTSLMPERGKAPKAVAG